MPRNPSEPMPPHCRGFTITHTPLWTSDRPDAETTRQHKTLTRDRYPYPLRDSNPQFQQAAATDYALDRAATEISTHLNYREQNLPVTRRLKL
jgi:hypothetical protein